MLLKLHFGADDCHTHNMCERLRVLAGDGGGAEEGEGAPFTRHLYDTPATTPRSRDVHGGLNRGRLILSLLALFLF